LLLIEGTPVETKERQPEMVFYQPTPARIVLELVEKASLKKEDVFYDMGSGLGQVSMLVNLLSGVRAKGVEFEPAYCDYARRCAKELNLSRVEFINADAREMDYSDGTVFFMYTPFEGKLLQEVLEKLKGESQRRKIRVCTYGPCTLQVSRQSWLKRVDQNGNSVHQLAVFKSV
jgi:precorrin-6B methylase 2